MSDLLYDFDERIPLNKETCPPTAMKGAIQIWRMGDCGLEQLLKARQVLVPRRADYKAHILNLRRMCMLSAGIDDAQRAGGECFEVDDANPALYISAVRADVTRMNGVMGFLMFASGMHMVREEVTIPVSWHTTGGRREEGRSAYRVVRTFGKINKPGIVSSSQADSGEIVLAMWSPKGDGVFEKWTAA